MANHHIKNGEMLLYSSVISLTPPYSFERLLRRLETHPDPQLLVNVQESTLRRVFRVGARPILVSLQFAGTMEQPFIRLHTEVTLSASEQQLLEKTIRHVFSADLDLNPIYEHMRQQQPMVILTERFRGLRLMLDSDLFQSMVKTIIGQQINLAFAAALTQRLMELAGDVMVDETGHKFMAFPTEEAVARLEPTDLRPLQFSQRKAEYIIDYARAIVNGTVDLDRLWQMEDDEIIEHLTAQRGIGRWTVECLMMFGMGRPDLLPAADIGLRNGLQMVYELAEKPDEKEIRRIGEDWRPWRSVYSLYIWEAVGAVRRKETWE
ncbi:DNA-3-methyladenine glycosylase family protein [Brevibacillus centrosporus]|uniref:DNA-3-methyladenine glycosylase II n=1 Tax=Brevibacillus centrosporus TaxID=54910 RepID=A0A1I3QRB3_9BACL|nr:DNA-3-methyladenine glycosylase [Brevibacillus centrosporus]SFJ36415.1 DNA-3-methyladenine glycosylase II [Brevibacillus centrosporus]